MEEIDTNELYERIFDLEAIRYNLEDKLDAIKEFLLHSNITLEEMEKIGEIINE